MYSNVSVQDNEHIMCAGDRVRMTPPVHAFVMIILLVIFKAAVAVNVIVTAAA